MADCLFFYIILVGSFVLKSPELYSVLQYCIWVVSFNVA